MAYLGLQFGEPLVFHWGRNVPGWAQEISLKRFHGLGWDFLAGRIGMDHVNVLFGFVGLSLSMLCWRRNSRSYALWSLAATLITFTNFVGIGRYLASIFPLFVVCAVILRSTNGFLMVCYFSTLLLALLSIMYSHWYWVT